MTAILPSGEIEEITHLNFSPTLKLALELFVTFVTSHSPTTLIVSETLEAIFPNKSQEVVITDVLQVRMAASTHNEIFFMLNKFEVKNKYDNMCLNEI